MENVDRPVGELIAACAKVERITCENPS